MPKPCSEKRVPPAKKHMPRTRTASHVTVQRQSADRGRVPDHLRRLLSMEPTTGKHYRSVFELSNRVNTAKYRTSRMGAVAVKRENGNRLT
jgi:hypothetical protein